MKRDFFALSSFAGQDDGSSGRHQASCPCGRGVRCYRARYRAEGVHHLWCVNISQHAMRFSVPIMQLILFSCCNISTKVVHSRKGNSDRLLCCNCFAVLALLMLTWLFAFLDCSGAGPAVIHLVETKRLCFVLSATQFPKF